MRHRHRAPGTNGSSDTSSEPTRTRTTPGGTTGTTGPAARTATPGPRPTATAAPPGGGHPGDRGGRHDDNQRRRHADDDRHHADADGARRTELRQRDLGWLAVLELLALVLLPGLYVAWRAPAEGRPMNRVVRLWALIPALALTLRHDGGAAARAAASAAPVATDHAHAKQGCTESYGGHAQGRLVVGDQAAATHLPRRRRLDQHQQLRHADGRQAHRPAGPRADHGQLVGRPRSGGRASNPYGENGLNQEYPVVIMQCRGVGPEELRGRHRAIGQRSGLAADLLDRLGRPALQVRQPGARRSGTRTPPTATAPSTSQGIDAGDVPATLQRHRQLRLLDDAVPGDRRHDLPGVRLPATCRRRRPSTRRAPRRDRGVHRPRRQRHGPVRGAHDVENESLGCSATVPCSIVVIPIDGISCDNPDPDALVQPGR